MRDFVKTALGFTSTLLLASGCASVDADAPSEPDDETTATSSQAITNGAGARSPSELALAAIGVERRGVVTPTCTGAFLYNDIVLTHRRCVESIPFGSRLVATNAIDRNIAFPVVAPWATSVEWVPASESSALAFDSDLAMVRLVRNVATGRRDDVNATTGFVRRLRSTSSPITATTDLRCFGFSFANNRLSLGERLVRVATPGSRVVTVRAGFGETADRSDDGGACIAPDGTLAGLLRFADSTTWNLVDVSRSPWMPVEIADAYRGSAAAEQFGLWPLTFTSVTHNHSIDVRLNGMGGYVTRAAAPASIWAQGFVNVVLSSTASTTDVQIRHRGTGYCVVPGPTGFGLATCITNPPSISPQRLRVFSLDDGSVQILSTSLQQCVTEVNGQVTMRPCNSATAGQRWFQGLGRR